MPKTQQVKEGDESAKQRKTTLRSTKSKPLTDNDGAEGTTSSMANFSEVLHELKEELKAFRHELNTKADATAKQLSELTNSITTLEDNIVSIKTEVATNTQRITETEERMSNAEDKLKEDGTTLALALKRIAQLEEKTNDLENRGRRKNLRLFGLKEGALASRTPLEYVSSMLPKWLELDQASIMLERVHWVGPSSSQNRAVLIRFLRDQDKERVLRAAKKRDVVHDGVKLAFVQDLSPETMRQRREFTDVKRLFIENGTFRGFHHNPCKMRILHQGRIQLLSSPQEAENFYRSTKTEKKN